MKRISTFREPLMGFAILWVFLYHSGIVFSGWLRPLSWLKCVGYGGVDIFMLLAGVGLYFSLSSDGRLRRFYRARFVRIMPTYWIVVTAATLLNSWVLHTQYSYRELFEIFSTLGFWMNGAKFDWYVPAIVGVYAAFPLVFGVVQKSEHKAWVTAAIAAASLLFGAVIFASRFDYLLIFTTRIPIFMFGVYLGYLLKSGELAADSGKHMRALSVSSILVGAVALAYVFKGWSDSERWAYGLWWYPFIAITPVLCNWLAGFFELCMRVRPGRAFVEGLRVCGKHSLEIYLVHRALFDLHPALDRYFDFDPSKLIEYAVFLAITLPIVIVLQRLVGMLVEPRAGGAARASVAG